MYNQITRQPTFTEEVLKEIFLLVKLHNNSSVYNLTQGELAELARNIDEQYSPMVLRNARDEVKKYYANKALTIGVFLEKCAEHARAHQSLVATERHLKTPKEQQKEAAKENIAQIKKLLSESNAIKKLPYDKKMRATSYEHYKAGQAIPLPRYEACTLDMPIWDKDCYSDGPALYAKCVAVGHILPFEVIENVELRELYKKAWSQGLTKDEKERMSIVSRECGERVVGLGV